MNLCYCGDREENHESSKLDYPCSECSCKKYQFLKTDALDKGGIMYHD